MNSSLRMVVRTDSKQIEPARSLAPLLGLKAPHTVHLTIFRGLDR